MGFHSCVWPSRERIKVESLWNNRRLLHHGKYLFTSLKKHHKNEVWTLVLVHFWSVFSINVILTHTKKGQSKQVHFRELKPHLIGQTPGLEMYSFFLERSRTLHTMLQPAKASGAKWFISGRWLVRFPSLVGTQIFGAHEHRIRQTCITRPFFHLTCLVWWTLRWGFGVKSWRG